jgi:hypothetical protein
MNQALGFAVMLRQKELNEIREAVDLPISTNHEELLIFLRQLKNYWDADDE